MTVGGTDMFLERIKDVNFVFFNLQVGLHII